MMAVLVFLLWLAALAVMWPSLVFFVECLCARPRTKPFVTTGTRPRIAVLVPAHDEETNIAATVAALRAGLAETDRLLVVADNCSDGTAQAAAAAGAEIVERHDPSNHGKGFALAFGVEHLSKFPPDVVIVVDADCRVSADGLEALACMAARTGRPVQAEYLLTLPPKPDARSALSGLAFLVRNLVRPRGLHRLGLPCQLTGSGMAFPWSVLRDAPPLRANLVEDMVLGIELALVGTPPILCSAVSVSSALPEPGKVQLRQRQRWEHGHLATLMVHGPRLLLAGMARRRAGLIAMALDLMVPPLALSGERRCRAVAGGIGRRRARGLRWSVAALLDRGRADPDRSLERLVAIRPPLVARTHLGGRAVLCVVEDAALPRLLLARPAWTLGAHQPHDGGRGQTSALDPAPLLTEFLTLWLKEV
jgi:hypothetical protein